MLEELRKEQGFTKEQVCRGLCSITALNRYEQDERIPEKFLVDGLLERLGKEPYQYEFVSTDEEFNLSIKRSEIEKSVKKREYEKAREILRAYRLEIGKPEQVHMQYICLKEGELYTAGMELEKAFSKYKEALKCTDCLKIYEKRIGNNRRVL